MTGICGEAGGGHRGGERMAAGLEWSGAEQHHAYRADGVYVRRAYRPAADRTEPATSGSTTVWLWGNVYGTHGSTGYRSLTERSETPALTCARLFDRHGPGVAARLNGDFFILVHDRAGGTLSFVTDRLGTRDVYYTRTDDGSVVFSSRIQSLADHPGVRPSFDRDYLSEYFAFRRSFGTATPLSDVFMVPPASVTTFDIDAGALRKESYWRPRHRPVDRPFSFFVDEFIERFQQSLRERVAAGGDGAVLLSGGSDSRLLLAALPDRDVTAYHIADWMNREARITERVALTAGVEFELLRRDQDEFRTLLQRTPPMNNFVQRFHQAHAEGFIDRLRGEHDYVLTNHLADVLFKGHYVPNVELGAGPLGTASLPIRHRIRSVDGFLDWTANPAPPFLETPPEPRMVLSDNLERERGGYRYHGVRYESLRDLVLYNRVWPATNGTDSFFRRSLHENLVHHIPLLDTRLLDLWLAIPMDYLLRHDLVNAAVSRLAPDLAEIPHANTGVPLTWSFPFDHLGRYIVGALRNGLSLEDDPPLPWLSHGPWGDKATLLRHDDFVLETIHEHEDVLRRLPFLDRDGALRCYREHVDGQHHTRELLALTTFLTMPITRRIASSNHESSVDGSARRPRVRAE